MILFRSDWNRYPTAIIDTKTTNETFLRQAKVYKDMGVKNWMWPLALLQPALQGVDPFSPDLTLEQKNMIGMECRSNPWYFFREVVRIPPVAGPHPIPFKANRGNLALIWLHLNNIDVALIQPRQTGKSVSTDTLMVYLMFIAASNTKINMITKDDTLRKANVERLKKIRDLLPKYLVNLTKRDSDNQTELTCKAYENTYVTGVAQNSESTANNLGRGLTSPVGHIDEGPFINFIGTTLPAALASGTAAREEAESYNRPYGNIFTTTAGKKDDRDGRFMYDFIHGGATWTEHFYDAKHKRELQEMIKKGCSGNKLLVNATFSHRQLGKTDEWLWKAIAEAGASGEAADRDFFNVWTSGTQSSPLSVKLNEIIRNSEREVAYTEVNRNFYTVRWYIPEEEIADRMARGHFVMGLDPSEAVGKDHIGLVILDAKDLAVVGTARINETNLILYSYFVADLLLKYRRITLVMERKSSGMMINDNLILILTKAGVDPFKRIYNTIVDEAQQKIEDYRNICGDLNRRQQALYDRYKKCFGFNTTGASRDTLYGTVLQNAAKRGGHKVHDKDLSTEIRGLVVKRDRIDHQASGNDDMVISWLLCHWFLTHSKNLDHYGIDPAEILTDISEAGREYDPEAEAERIRQLNYRKEIDDVYEELRKARDEFMAAKLEHRLRVLSERLTEENEIATSISDLIQQAKEARRQTHRTAHRQRPAPPTQGWGSMTTNSPMRGGTTGMQWGYSR